jgi:putative flavoprotein involved in K+ transport
MLMLRRLAFRPADGSRRSVSRLLCSAASQKVSRWLSAFEGRLGAATAHECFSESRCFWRDMVAFTWSIQTFEGRENTPGLYCPGVDEHSASSITTQLEVGRHAHRLTRRDD